MALIYSGITPAGDNRRFARMGSSCYSLARVPLLGLCFRTNCSKAAHRRFCSWRGSLDRCFSKTPCNLAAASSAFSVLLSNCAERAIRFSHYKPACCLASIRKLFAYVNSQPLGMMSQCALLSAIGSYCLICAAPVTILPAMPSCRDSTNAA